MTVGDYIWRTRLQHCRQELETHAGKTITESSVFVGFFELVTFQSPLPEMFRNSSHLRSTRRSTPACHQKAVRQSKIDELDPVMLPGNLAARRCLNGSSFPSQGRAVLVIDSLKQVVDRAAVPRFSTLARRTIVDPLFIHPLPAEALLPCECRRRTGPHGCVWGDRVNFPVLGRPR